jgi:hypothetical protein
LAAAFNFNAKYRMKKSLLLVFLVCSLITCRQGDTEYTDDELVNPESVMAYEEDDTLVLRRIPAGLAEWLTFYGKSDTAFTLKNFKASGVTLHMDILQDATGREDENSFRDLLVYSPDSSMYLDLVSYNYLKEKQDGKNILISGDPDQQVVLADTRNKMKKQLMYNGPSQLAEFAEWTSNSSFIIGMTSKEEGMSGMKAEIYFFHLKDSSFTNFLLNHQLPVDSLSPFKSSFLEYYFNSRQYEVK